MKDFKELAEMLNKKQDRFLFFGVVVFVADTEKWGDTFVQDVLMCIDSESNIKDKYKYNKEIVSYSCIKTTVNNEKFLEKNIVEYARLDNKRKTESESVKDNGLSISDGDVIKFNNIAELNDMKEFSFDFMIEYFDKEIQEDKYNAPQKK